MESKLKNAAAAAAANKRIVTKRELEKMRKAEEETAAAQAFEEFVATFQEPPSKQSKVWIKAGTFNAGTREESTTEKGRIYKPTIKLQELAEKFSSPNAAAAPLIDSKDKPEKPGKKKEKEKKKSNLEIFKEELKIIQEERSERHRVKTGLKDGLKVSRFEPQESSILRSSIALDNIGYGSYDNGDPTTTNLYLGNLNPKMTEQRLMEIFGRYGPLASIKIMWPRSDEAKARGRNCGFVAYMNRKDGERALKALLGKDVDGYEMKLGWGKSIPIPPNPIYIPPALVEMSLPPPPSGLPFNAQPLRRDRDKLPGPGAPPPISAEEQAEFSKILQRAVVKVVIPTERHMLVIIHRMIEFVVREGPMFEAMIMNREMNNPLYRFLFDNKSPAHIYYLWKLYSILQGDTQNRWRTQDFRLFKGGSIWRPPPMNPYLQGMPENVMDGESMMSRKGSLSSSQRDRLEDMVRHLTPEREKIAEVMVWCIEHAEAADEICQCISEALTNPDTSLPKKVARLYLVSDILHNCGAKVTNASAFRKFFQEKLLEVFMSLHEAYAAIDARLRAEAFKVRVSQCIRVWEDWTIYPQDFLIRLQNIFLGLTSDVPDIPPEISEEPPQEEPLPPVTPVDDIDGVPLSDKEDLDGVPLDGAALLKGALRNAEVEDLDGVPMSDDVDGMPMEEEDEPSKNTPPPHPLPGFVPSKWETVDPNDIEAQAVTTSKWDLVEPEETPPEVKPEDEGQADEDVDGVPMEEESAEEEEDGEDREMNEEKRARLREIEVKVMLYQDELESGMKSVKRGYTLTSQVQHYRDKLLRKAERIGRSDSERRAREKQLKLRNETDEDSIHLIKRKSRSPSHRSRSSKKSRSSSKSPKRHRSRSRSRSPRRRHRSRSRSPRKHKKKSKR